MDQIIIQKCDDGTYWVTSNDDQIGSESYFSNMEREEYKFLVALADFLLLRPSDLIHAGEMWQALDEEE